MGGGLLQLVAYGAQDVYLTGNPQITFFKVAYRRHTNFALEAIQQTFNGNPSYGSRVTCQISRNGDLIHRVYLQVDLNDTSDAGPQYCRYFGHRLLNYVEVEIGGQRIDRHYSHWLYVWNELSLPVGKRRGYNQMVGAYGYKNIDKSLYIPLEFWFCRNVGLALPLIALQYHEVKININFEAVDKCVMNSGTAGLNLGFAASLWVDYVYLDTDERRRFAQLSHEYLIEQLQFTGQEAITGPSIKPKLSFNHPCKELIFFASTNTGNNWFNYTTSAGADWTNVETFETLKSKLTQTNFDYSTRNSNSEPSNPIKTAKLVLNGNDRFYDRPGRYFNVIQPFQHHENIPTNAGINVYSFSLKPEEHQPSGSLNMSRIDTAVLNLTFEDNNTLTGYNATNYNLYVYAVNYNVLRILSGMGGLAYSN